MKHVRWLLAALLLASASLHAKPPEAQKTRVAILMFDGVQVIDFAGPYEVFGQAGFAVHTVSRDGKAVTTAMNLRVNVDHAFDTAPPVDVVVVPGGDVEVVSKDAATLAWLRKSAGSAKQVLSICTGSDILAATGLLDGQSATTFHRHFDHMQATFPKVRVVRDRRWVETGKLVTSAGLASGIDAALHVVANLRDVKAARSVALHLEYDWSPESGFIRGLMADQFARMPAQPLQFPEGTDIAQVSSIGNAKDWETEYLVTSPLAPAALLRHIGERARADPDLEVLPQPDALQLAWQYRSPRGGCWRTSLQAFDRQADRRYRVVARIVRLD